MAELAELEMRRGSMRVRRSPKSQTRRPGANDATPSEPDSDPEPGSTSEPDAKAAANTDTREAFREQVKDLTERGKTLSFRGILQSLAGLLVLGGVGIVCGIMALKLPLPGLPWHMLWWAALLLWLALLFPASLLRHFLHRPVGNFLATVVGGALLFGNPAFTGLALGTAAWVQGAAFDEQLDDEGEETSSFITRVDPLHGSYGGGNPIRFVFNNFADEVTYTYTVNEKTFKARGIYDGALSSADRGPIPAPNRAGRTIRYLPSNPWIHQPDGNSFVDTRLTFFTTTCGILLVFIFGVGGWLRLSKQRKRSQQHRPDLSANGPCRRGSRGV